MSKKNRQKPTVLAQKHIITAKAADSRTKPNSPKQSTNRWMAMLPLLLILLATYFIYKPTSKYNFVNWDDDKFCYENQLITDMTAQNFWTNSKQMFKKDFLGAYAPLTIFTLGLDHRYGGDTPFTGVKNPGSWHMTNVWLHLLAIIFAYLIAQELGLGMLAASIVAFLFALHPMRVESVAWVTERKDVLYGSLYLIAIYSYIKYKKSKSYLAIVISYVCFLLSLLAKIQAVALPLSLIAVDYLIDKKFVWRSVWSKTLFFLMSFAIGAYGVSVLSGTNTLDQSATNYSFIQRLFVGSYSYLVYLIKLIIPYQLTPLYPYPGVFPAYFYPTMIIVPIVLYAIYWGFQKGHHNLVFSLVFFSFNIFFLLQILGAGQGFTADRYTYIAYFGLFFGIGYLFQKYSNIAKYNVLSYSIVSVFLLAMATVSAKQIPIWENSATMWSQVLKYHKQATTPYGNRANYYRAEKMWDLAMADYNASLALKETPGVLNSRGKLFFDKGNKNTDSLRMALKDFNKAISLKTDDGEYYSNRGAANAILGNDSLALADFSRSILLKPENTAVYLNRSLTYDKLGNYQAAIADLKYYLTLKPEHTDIYYEIGRFYAKDKDFASAIKHFDIAISREQKNFYFVERSLAYLNSGNKPKAKEDILKAKALGYTQADILINNYFK